MNQIEQEMNMLESQNTRLNGIIEQNNRSIEILHDILTDIAGAKTMPNKIMTKISEWSDISVVDLL